VCENREKRLEFAWSGPSSPKYKIQTGQAHKVRGCGEAIRFRYHGNIVLQDRQPNTNGSTLPFFQCIVIEESSNNVYVWAGPLSWPGLAFETLTNPDGSTARVPAAFQLDYRDRAHLRGGRYRPAATTSAAAAAATGRRLAERHRHCP
jgi:hypothetical protein